MSSPGDPAAAPVAGAGNTGSSENVSKASFPPHNLFSAIRRCQEIRIIFLSQGLDFSRNKNIEGLDLGDILILGA